MVLPSYDFRWEAREALTRAKQEIVAGGETHLRYAALELRGGLEALVYDRAMAIIDDIPPEHLSIWQPRQFMGLLLQIDPTLDFACTVSAGRETEVGLRAPSEAMKTMGTETPLTLKNLKDHYDALGSYLHMPTIERARSGHLHDYEKLRQRCETVVEVLDKVLASRIWNAVFSQTASLRECANEECKRPITRRLPDGKTEINTRCFACNVEYRIEYGAGDNQVVWVPKQERIACVQADCDGGIVLWSHEIKVGRWWKCRDCGTANGILLAVDKIEPPTGA